MDEAERCTRLGILDAGRLVADGSPRELMDALPGHPLLIECAQPRAAQRALQGHQEVLASAQIGATLRVLCASENARDDIAATLRRAGVDAELRDGEANLEDVFVAVTRKPLEATP
jgi:ABC-2 type transport system ATP-binding protein